MLISFDEIIEVTLHHEGGYVHDPKDLGGETNFGISKILQKRKQQIFTEQIIGTRIE